MIDDRLRPPSVTVEHVVKRFGDTQAVRGVSVDVRDGETFVLLGPSGCGKTTLLNIVAGIHAPDSGRVLFGDREVTDVPMRNRNVGMVFQRYALFPHMTVSDNVAFGLRARKVNAGEVTTRVEEALDLVDLSRHRDRWPAQLSGGEQQRVALARALVIRPDVLLLDEPFGALDLKLRQRMQVELRDLLRRVGTNAIHVTHDQEEAFTLASRIGVMRDGRLEQVGTAEELYNTPATRFVASFLGEANLFPVEDSDKTKVLCIGDKRIPVRDPVGDGQFGCVRPETLELSLEPTPDSIPGEIRSMVFLGDVTRYEVSAGGVVVSVQRPGPAAGLEAGDTVHVQLPPRVPLVTP